MLQLPLLAVAFFSGPIAAVFSGPTASVDPNPANLVPTTEQSARAEELVKLLGSEDFQERDAASRELAELGRLALAAVERTLAETTSAEVRARCEALLPLMLQEDLKARLAAFMADTEAKYDHKLPGWEAFQRVVGDTKEARKVFAGMYEQPQIARLLTASTGPQGEFTRLLNERRQDLHNRFYGRGTRMVGPNGVIVQQQERQKIELPEITAGLFVESLHANALDRRHSHVQSALLNQPHLRQELAEPNDAAIHRKLIAHWCETRLDPMEQYQAMNLAANLNIKEASAIKLASKLLDQKAVSPNMRATTLCMLARLGGKESLPEILKHLNDQSVYIAAAVNVGGQIERTEMQIRDIALAMALVLTEQPIEDYGFELRNKNVNNQFLHTNYLLKPNQREAAFAKWQESQTKK